MPDFRDVYRRKLTTPEEALRHGAAWWHWVPLPPDPVACQSACRWLPRRLAVTQVRRCPRRLHDQALVFERVRFHQVDHTAVARQRREG
jgi:hypothetical protein